MSNNSSKTGIDLEQILLQETKYLVNNSVKFLLMSNSQLLMKNIKLLLKCTWQKVTKLTMSLLLKTLNQNTYLNSLVNKMILMLENGVVHTTKDLSKSITYLIKLSYKLKLTELEWKNTSKILILSEKVQ